MTTDAVGGVWRYSVELSRGLAARGSDVTLAVVGPAATDIQLTELAPSIWIEQTGLPLDWLTIHPAELDHASRRLSTLAADFDVVLLHAPALLRERWPVPVVAVAHSCLATWFDAVRQGPVPQEFAWRAQATAAGLGRATVAVAPSHGFAAALRRVTGVSHVTVIHNGREPLPQFSRARERAVLASGRLWDEGKDIALLDRVAARLSAPVRAAGATVDPAGNGAIFHHLTLLGTLGEAALADAYAGATVFASAARYEPFGLAVLEAAQAGMALVLSDIPTFRELWEGAATFVPPGDDAAWVQALEATLAGPTNPGMRARQHASRYTASAMVDGTAAALARAVG